MGSYFKGGSPSNYTIGGVRFWFSRLVDAASTPPKYEGYRDMGNVIEGPFETTKDELDHNSARTGTRKRDRSLVRELTEDIVLTMDELDVPNLRDYFNGSDVTDVVEALGGGVVTDEVAKVKIGDTTILGKGFNAASIVVKDITNALTYTTPDDYDLVDIIGGYVGLTWKTGAAGSNLANGDFVRISYVYDIRLHKSFAPLTTLEIKGKAVFFGVSDTGNEFIREFENVQIEREGTFSINSDDWSSFQIRVKILDDSENNPSFPAGIFRHYGVGTDL